MAADRYGSGGGAGSWWWRVGVPRSGVDGGCTGRSGGGIGFWVGPSVAAASVSGAAAHSEPESWWSCPRHSRSSASGSWAKDYPKDKGAPAAAAQPPGRRKARCAHRRERPPACPAASSATSSRPGLAAAGRGGGGGPVAAAPALLAPRSRSGRGGSMRLVGCGCRAGTCRSWSVARVP
jgi:hypothetical protein